MPDDDLRDIYKKRSGIQKTLAALTWIPLLPVGFICGVGGWAGFLASEHSMFSYVTDGGASIFLFFAAFALCGALMMSKSPKTFIGIPFVMLAGIVIKKAIYGGSYLIGIAMLIYVISACITLYFAVSDLNFLRELPHFPFVKRRDEINFNAMNRDVMLRYLETAEKGGIAKPPEKTEEYLQQHKMLYKNRKA